MKYWDMHISLPLLEKFVYNGVNVVDCAGNIHIRYMKAGRLVFSVTNKGEKNIFAKDKVYPIFQEASLKVIFYLLQDKKNVNKDGKRK